VEPLPARDRAGIRDQLGLGRAEAQGAMRPGPVVVVEVLAQDLDEVALAQDDQPIQTLSPSGAKHPLAGSVRARARNGVRAILTPAAKKTVSKSELYFESRSWIRTLIGIFSSSSSHATFRAWLCHPGRVGMCGGVAEDDTARADVQEDEHVQDTQADAVDGQEVARPEPRGRERGETATKSGRCAVAPGPVDNGEGSCGSSSSRPYSRA
jgi:hypothetical protein